MEGSLAQDIPPSSKCYDSKLQEKFSVFFSLLHPAAPDGPIFGIAGKSGFQKSDKKALGSCDKLINHLQIRGNIISNSIQAAQWKLLYLLSVKINVLLKMQAYCMELFSIESTCWKVATDCIYLGQFCINQHASKMTFCVSLNLVILINFSSKCCERTFKMHSHG